VLTSSRGNPFYYPKLHQACFFQCDCDKQIIEYLKHWLAYWFEEDKYCWCRSNLIGVYLTKATIEDEGASVKSSGPKLDKSVTGLDIGNNPNMTEVGWQAIFDDVSTNPTYKLEKLDLSSNSEVSNSFKDTMKTSLMIALGNNNTTKTLCLFDDIGAEWLDQLSRLLPSPIVHWNV
jgi:hypothetical protein